MSASQPIEWTVAQLAQAVERGQLELHYQPIVDLRSEQIVGAEALLRWRHPTLGLLPPGQFLPVVESSGLMPEIGAWVLGAACRQMRDWRVLAWQPFRLAVNVSASQVGPDFDGWVKGDSLIVDRYPGRATLMQCPGVPLSGSQATRPEPRAESGHAALILDGSALHVPYARNVVARGWLGRSFYPYEPPRRFLHQGKRVGEYKVLSLGSPGLHGFMSCRTRAMAA
jgi:hypothetical protein